MLVFLPLVSDLIIFMRTLDRDSLYGKALIYINDQSSISEQNVATLHEGQKAYVGGFQCQMIDSKKGPGFPLIPDLRQAVAGPDTVKDDQNNDSSKRHDTRASESPEKNS
tara:strand:- start:375 stop:704 length:330 start_codon:yes stop_codon:yes gene_type:complete